MKRWTSLVFKVCLGLRAHRGVEAKDAGRVAKRAHTLVRERAARPRTLASATLCGALVFACITSSALSVQAEITQQGDLRVAFQGEIQPRALPRSGAAPVTVSIGTRIATADGATPPQLRSISIAVNRHGHFEPGGLPLCSLREIQPATNATALAVCRSALIGHGTFSAKVLLPQSAPFPSEGQVLAFNGSFEGRPAILAHVYGPKPIPTSYTIPFVLVPSKGTFGTTLTASLPQVTGDSGYITGLTLNLNRTFSSHGKRRSYVSASCPAPRGIALVSFPFARASFGFAGGKALTSTLTRSCRVRR